MRVVLLPRLLAAPSAGVASAIRRVPWALLPLALGCASASAVDRGVADVAVGAVGASAPVEPPPGERAPARDAADAPGAFAFVTKLGASHWLILAQGSTDLAASDPIFLTDPTASLLALEAKVAPPSLDPAMRLERRRFDVWRGATRVCTAIAGRTRLVGVTTMPQELMISDEAGNVPTPTAKTIWPYARTYLAAPLDVPEGCDVADAWGRLSELPEPRFATLRAAPAGALEAQLTTAFRASPGWRHAQAQLVASRDGGDGSVTTTWEQEGTSTLQVWDAPFLGAAFAVRQGVWEEGCGASASLTMAFRLDAPASSVSAEGLKASLRFEGEDTFDVDLVLDLDRDGKLEMIGTTRGDRSLRAMWGVEHQVEGRDEILGYVVPVHDCGC